MLVLDAGFLLIMGESVPIGAMAASTLLAALLVAAVLSVGSLVLVVDERLMAFVIPVAFIMGATWAWWNATTTSPVLPGRGVAPDGCFS